MAKKRLPADVREYFRKEGAKGGKIGGKLRLTTMTAEERSAVAKNAAEARWKKEPKVAQKRLAKPKE